MSAAAAIVRPPGADPAHGDDDAGRAAIAVAGPGRRAASGSLVLQAAVSVVALAAVGWWASRQPLPSVPDAGTAAPGLAAALGLYALATLLRGERWLRLLRSGGMHLGRGDAHALTTVGYMGNNALPARAGDLMKGLLSAGRVGARRSDALGMLVAERLLDAVALALLFVVLVTTLRLPLGVPGWALGVVGALLLAAAGAATAFGRRTAQGRRARALAAALLAPTRGLFSGAGAALLALSLAVWLVEAGVYAVLGGVAGIDLSLLDGLYIMAVANLIALVPAAPGYVGTFDAAVVLALGLVASAAHPDALAYVVLVRFVLFVPITLVGLAALMARYGGLRRVRALRVRAPATP